MTGSYTNDVLGLLASSAGKPGLVLDEVQLGADFFDLATGFAGELLQKFTVYNVRLAIVLRDRGRYGERIRELASEHDRHSLIRFLPDREAAERWVGSTET